MSPGTSNLTVTSDKTTEAASLIASRVKKIFVLPGELGRAREYAGDARRKL